MQLYFFQSKKYNSMTLHKTCLPVPKTFNPCTSSLCKNNTWSIRSITRTFMLTFLAKSLDDVNVTITNVFCTALMNIFLHLFFIYILDFVSYSHSGAMKMAKSETLIDALSHGSTTLMWLWNILPTIRFHTDYWTVWFLWCTWRDSCLLQRFQALCNLLLNFICISCLPSRSCNLLDTELIFLESYDWGNEKIDQTFAKKSTPMPYFFFGMQLNRCSSQHMLHTWIPMSLMVYRALPSSAIFFLITFDKRVVTKCQSS